MAGSERLKVCTYLKHFKQDSRVDMRYAIFHAFICFGSFTVMINIKMIQLKNASNHFLVNTFFC